MMSYPFYNIQPQPQAQPQANPDERIWVQSEAQAEAYLVAPGSFVRLWHISEPIFYEKGCDVAGRPTPMATYKYEKVAKEALNIPKGITEWESKLNSLEARLEALEGKEAKEDERHD